MTFRRGAGGVYCGSCRKKAGLKYTVISVLLGWWGIPWGPIYTLQAIGRNSAGGHQDDELNSELLQAVASELIDQGNQTGAIEALEQSLRLHDNGAVRQVLWSLQGEAVTSSTAAPALGAPAKVNFRPGELVRSAEGESQLYAQPAPAGEPVGLLAADPAVVTRSQDEWLEVQVPGGRSGWVRTSAVESA
jgi:hypothetical protein